MQLKPVILTSVLLMSMAHGTYLEAKTPEQKPGAQNGKAIEGDLAEWELLKGYLREVEKRSEMEIEMAYSDYKLRRMIFKESNRRWWEIYKEDQRKEKINDYWKRFYAGQEYARGVVTASVGNYCGLLNKIDLSSMQSPVEDENMNEAFKRGFKGAYPECSIPNLDQFLKDTDKRISAIEKKITDIKTNLIFTKPNEQQTEVIYNELKKKYVEVVKNHLVTAKESLEKAYVIPANELNRLKESANLLAQTIGCSTLKSRAGERFTCTVQVLDPAIQMGVASTYRVLKGEQDVGAFQPRIFLGQLFMASAVYLREVNPSNQMVRYLADDINLSLAKIEQESRKRMNNARILIAEDFFNKIRTMSFETINLNRDVFSREGVREIIKELLDIKPTVESYVRFDMATQYEGALLKKVLSHYRSTLKLATSIEAEVHLPQRDIIVVLEDEATSDVVTLDRMPTPPKAYLLGLTSEEVSEWMNILDL